MAKQIVIIGAGFGGLYTALNLSRSLKLGAGVSVTLVSKRNYFLFTPLLHEVATGSVNQSNVVQPLQQILRKTNVDLVVGEAGHVDRTRKVVRLDGRDVPYDYLVLATGSTTRVPDFVKSPVFTLKSLDEARQLKNHLIDCFQSADASFSPEARRRLLRFVVVGGGATGVELAAELADFACGTLKGTYPGIACEEVEVVLVQSGPRLLPRFSSFIAERSLTALRERQKVRVLLNETVTAIDARGVRLETGSVLETETPILAAGIEPVLVPLEPAAATNGRGQVVVNEFLQLPHDENVYAVGDAAEAKSRGQAVPPTAQSAEAMARSVSDNLAAQLRGKPLHPFVYRERGQLVSLGSWLAAAELYSVPLFGHFAWWVWRTIYAMKLVGWANRMRVVLDWTIDIFYPRDISRV